jgi:quinol monooxygenase YgiN
MKLHVVAHFHSRPSRGKELEALLSPLVEPTLREDGCIAYLYYRDMTDPDHFVFIEQWRDEVSLDVHLTTDHVRRMLLQVDGLLASPIEGYRLTAR